MIGCLLLILTTLSLIYASINTHFPLLSVSLVFLMVELFWITYCFGYANRNHSWRAFKISSKTGITDLLCFQSKCLSYVVKDFDYHWDFTQKDSGGLLRIDIFGPLKFLGPVCQIIIPHTEDILNLLDSKQKHFIRSRKWHSVREWSEICIACISMYALAAIEHIYGKVCIPVTLLDIATISICIFIFSVSIYCIYMVSYGISKSHLFTLLINYSVVILIIAFYR